ncbi:hypothetical protein L0Y34_00715 [Candidatus Parcubacteria bacterium]|nr:hypothetical protein [Candidatus Parcubacteria bacterium]
MRTLVLIAALVAICTEVRAQEEQSWDSGVRIPLPEEEQSSSTGLIVVIGVREAFSFPDEFTPPPVVSFEENDEFGEGVYIARRRLGSFAGGEFNTRITETDPSSTYHGPPTDDRRSFELRWKF